MYKTASGVGERRPAVAGRFYPADPRQLRDAVHAYLGQPGSDPEEGDALVPKAIIVPHAGYIYSGPIAASGYHRVRAGRGMIKRVVLIGPAHYVPFIGVATSSYASFLSPLGPVLLDLEAIRSVLAKTSAWVYNEAHQPEHSLEVQLPFLQEVLGDFTLVPLLMGKTTPQEVAKVLEALWGGPETLLVISSDLSHYQNYEEASLLDRATSQAIERLAPQDIYEQQACGRLAIQALLDRAVAHHLRADTVDLRNSADTAGGAASRNRVVGYGAYVFV